MSEADAIKALPKLLTFFEEKRHLSLGAVAARLDCSVNYLRDHLDDFPGAWRMPGGEIRIPAKDVERLARERRFLKTEAAA
jgi:hypothetical protein